MTFITEAQRIRWVMEERTHIHSDGYVMIYCPYHHGAYRSYVYEHRLIVERMLGRRLEPGEKVHHKNEIRHDNRPENLVLVDEAQHQKIHRAGLTDAELEQKLLQGLSAKKIGRLGVDEKRVSRVRRDLIASGRRDVAAAQAHNFRYSEWPA